MSFKDSLKINDHAESLTQRVIEEACKEIPSIFELEASEIAKKLEMYKRQLRNKIFEIFSSSEFQRSEANFDILIENRSREVNESLIRILLPVLIKEAQRVSRIRNLTFTLDNSRERVLGILGEDLSEKVLKFHGKTKEIIYLFLREVLKDESSS